MTVSQTTYKASAHFTLCTPRVCKVAAQCITARRRHDAGCTQRRYTLDYDSSWRTLGLTEQLTLREDVSRQVPIAHDGKYLFFFKIPRLADWGEVCWFTKLAEECRYKNATKIIHDFCPNDGPIP